MAKRRHAIADRLNEFILAFSDTDLSSAEPSVENLIAGGENDMVEFKSSLRWDMATDQINKKLEDVVLKSISAFAYSDGGVLLIGVDDVGQVLGLAKDYASMDDGGRDKFERHLRQLARDKFGLSYTSTQLACDFCKIDGREICRVTIQPAHEPIVIKVSDKNGQSVERLYIRNGNASQELPVSEMHGYIKKRFALTHSSA